LERGLSHEDWLRLQEAINGSAQITDARLDALTKDGAMMTLTVGDLGRLANELSFKGVMVKSDPKIGTYLASNSYMAKLAVTYFDVIGSKRHG